MINKRIDHHMTKNNKNRSISTCVQKIIEIKSKEIAKKHNIDSKRIKKILESTKWCQETEQIIMSSEKVEIPKEIQPDGTFTRIIEVHKLNDKDKPNRYYIEYFDKENLPEGAKFRKTYTFIHFWPSIEEALRYFPLEQALEILEEKGRMGIIEGEANLYDLKVRSWFSLDELEQITKNFIAYQEENKESLIATGRPITVFKDPWWELQFLESLYYTKWPSGYKEIKGKDENLIYEYTWVKDTSEGKLDCSFEEAPLMDGLSTEDNKLVLAHREKIYQLRVDVLKKIIHALQIRDSSPLWEECLSLIRNYIYADELDFLLRLDQFYLDYFERKELNEAEHGLYSLGGGLSELLLVIAEFEAEIKFGFMSSVRSHLKKNFDFDQEGKPILPFENYLQVLSHPYKDDIVFAYGLISSLEREQHKFSYENYMHRVNKVLQEELDEVIEIRYPRMIRKQFRPYIESFAEWAKVQYEVTGELPKLEVYQLRQKNGQLERFDTSEDDSFQHSDDYLWIKYKGKEYELTTRQAQIVEILYRNHQKGIFELGEYTIMDELSTPDSRLRDTFRHRNKELLGTLVKKRKGGKTLRLDI